MSCDGLMKISDYLCTIFGLHGVFSVQRHTLAQKIRYSASRTLPRCFYVWGYAPYNPSTANQLKCSLLRLSISLDSWFRLLIPYSQLTLALWNNNPDIYVRQYSLFYTNIAQLFSFSPLLLYIFTNKELIPVFIFCNYLISIFL